MRNYWLRTLSLRYWLTNVSFAVDSNDRLYGCDKKFLAEVNSLVSTLMEAVFEHLKSLSSGEVSLDRAISSSRLHPSFFRVFYHY